MSETIEQKARRAHSLIRQEDGDDGYSWVLRVRGVAHYNGMQHGEAKFRRDRYIETGEL